jgi:nucleoside-diphosphate-sugar epimerase
MKAPERTAVVTGASGYLGSRICATLESRGWQVVRFVRSPSTRNRSCSYDLAAPISAEVREVLQSADVLVHAAYDLSLTNPVDIWRVNVEGTRRLLKVAGAARIRRILVLSSMSAYLGTTQLYGRAKLDIEVMTAATGGCAVRPGLVYGDRSGGMAGALRKLVRLPLVPMIAGSARQYTVREDDLMTALAALAEVKTLPRGTVCLAHPTPVAFRDLLTGFAAQEARQCRLVPVPWQLIYWTLRTGETLHVRLPFRADSLLGLVHTAPGVTGTEALTRLGVTLRAFDPSPFGRGKVRMKARE